MKKFVVLLLFPVLMASTGFAQSKFDFGINGHVGIPVGEMANRMDMGFGGGVLCIIPVSNPMIGLALGVSYESYPGKIAGSSFSGSSMSGSSATNIQASGLGSIFVGPKFGKESGPFFLPAISLNIMTEVRYGIDIGGGIVFPFGSGLTTCTLGAKYSLLNLFGGVANEIALRAVRIYAGIML